MKVKKKLRDLTPEEYRNWRTKYCIGHIDCSSSSHSTCDDCPFTSVICNGSDKKIWVNNKDLYSDKFLNQEIELEKPDILTKKEKECLQKAIGSFRNKVEYIAKINGRNGYEFISIGIGCNLWDMYGFPIEGGTMYKNMKVGKKYSLEELGLSLKKE